MLKKAMRLILSVILILNMAACATELNREDGIVGGEETQSQETDAGAPFPTEEEDAPVQYAYSSLIVDFSDYGSDAVVHDMAVKENRVYVLLEMREWGPEPTDSTQKWEYTSCYQIFTCLMDGSGREVSGKFYLPEGGYVNTMCLSDTGNVAACVYADTGETVRILFWEGFGDTWWEKEVASGGYLFSHQGGYVILARDGEERRIYNYDGQGELTGSLDADGEVFRDFRNCFLTPEGDFFW